MIVNYQLPRKPTIMKLPPSSILLVWSLLPSLFIPKYKELGIVLGRWSIKLVTRKIKILMLFQELGMLMLMLLLSWEIIRINILLILLKSLIGSPIQDKIELLEPSLTMITSQSSEIKGLCHNLTSMEDKTSTNKFLKIDKLLLSLKA